MAGAKRLLVALALLSALTLFECAGGFVSHSLALLSDSAHVAMDVVAIAIALAARLQTQRPANTRQSFGFARLEVLAALANGGFLFAVTGALTVAAVRRFFVPEIPQGSIMAGVAAIGFVLNLVVGFTLMRDLHAQMHHGHVHANGHDHDHHAHEHDRGNINTRAALMHVFGDALGALAVVFGGLAIIYVGVAWVDPLLSLIVAAILAVGTFRIMREAVDVLLESTPHHADIVTVREYLRTIEGVVDVHDLHVWSLDGREHILTAHVLLQDRRISEASAILRQVEASVRERFMITHVTLQFECEACEEDERVVCTQR
jgi:cobalt-zinc-cadmium efflux system protein